MAPTIRSIFAEQFPSPPKFTEKDLDDLSDKVYLITGGASGIGFELAKVLYSHNATVHIAGRNSDAGSSAIKDLKSLYPTSSGKLLFLQLDLADLTTVRGSAESFLSRETHLDALFLNAGVMHPPVGSKSTQGYELQLGTNVLGHFALQKHLMPLIVARKARVVWVSSDAHMLAPKGGVQWDDINFEKKKAGKWVIYGQSKAMAIILAKEMARRYAAEGVVAVSLNPGHLKTGLQRHGSGLEQKVMKKVLDEPWKGACTLLFAGLNPEIEKSNGGYVIPYGKIGEAFCSVYEANGETVWDWCEAEVTKYDSAS